MKINDENYYNINKQKAGIDKTATVRSGLSCFEKAVIVDY